MAVGVELGDAAPDRSLRVGDVVQNAQGVAEVLAALGQRASSNDALWKSALVEPARFLLATSMASEESMQCRRPTFGSTHFAQRPLPQPRAKPLHAGAGGWLGAVR